MIDLNKYCEKEIIAAVRTVEEIVSWEDFDLVVDKDIDNEPCFKLVDRQGANLGGIEGDEFYSLALIVDRMELYHNDYFYEAYDEREIAGEDIPQDDWDRKVLIFLESDYVAELLSAIDVETYEKYKNKEPELNISETAKYIKDQTFDNVGYLCDKSIALDIAETQSAYALIVHDSGIYDLYIGGNQGIADSFLEDLDADTDNLDEYDYSFAETFYDYISIQECLIKDDINDMGLIGDLGWDFYLSERELEYVGLGDEIKKYKENESLKDVKDTLGNAVNRAKENSNFNFDASKDVDKEK